MDKRNEKPSEGTIFLNGVEYTVTGFAYTLNEGEYYIAKRKDDDRNILIPTDSEDVEIAF